MAESNDNWKCLGEVPCFRNILKGAKAECSISLYVIKVGDEFMYKTSYNGEVCFVEKFVKWGFNAVFQPRNEEYSLFLNVPRW